MISDKLKNSIAQKNGLTKERFVESVRSDIRNELKLSTDDEIAILRKAVALLFDIVSTLHPEVNNAEFAEYNALVEEIKSSAKKTLGI